MDSSTKLLAEAIQVFITDKATQGLSDSVVVDTACCSTDSGRSVTQAAFTRSGD